jgi:hypothetical protein
VAKAPATEVQVGERTVRISNPDRVYFPATGATKRDLVDYYLAVGPGIVNALRERPCMMHRFPTGVSGEQVHQKRVPGGAPPWLQTVRVKFPRYGLHADELCVTELAAVIWAVQMSTVEFHPWNSRRADVEKPDEWRIDLDPMPDCPPATVGRIAHVVHEVLGEGAFGKVFLVKDKLQNDSELALKLIKKEHTATSEALMRFKNEILLLRVLSHPGIPQIFNDGRTPAGEYYYTMAYVEGVTLSQVLKEKGSLPPERVVRIVSQILDVLDADREADDIGTGTRLLQLLGGKLAVGGRRRMNDE